MFHADIISALGGNKAVAAICGVPDANVALWRKRQSIPRRFWPDITAAAKRKANLLLTITEEALQAGMVS